MRLLNLLCALMSACWLSSAQADVNSYFDHIKNNPNALYQFLKEMPKGGELHYHLAGGPSSETMLSLITKDIFCVEKHTLSVTLESSTCNGVLSKDISSDSDLYNKIVRSWSMKDFHSKKESGHDHFFNTFNKFMPIVARYRPQLIANVLQRAAAQNEHYLEIMDIADDANSLHFGNLIDTIATYEQKKEILLNNKEFQHTIEYTINHSEVLVDLSKKELGCNLNPQQKACQINIKFLYYILREQPINNFFAQALNAFEAVSRSKGSLVGVNMVQAEDGVISMRDYEKQMRVLNFLHNQYPKVHVALHAGELTSDMVPEKELTYHIHDALLIGKAQRIGHGVDITHEPLNTISYMAENQIPVEINLVSNTHILKISGPLHPLNFYLQHQVPVVLSTDDEGVLRTNLTKQYVEATLIHHLKYETLKQINRNTLTYAFLPGESIWSQANKGELIPACHDLDSKSCRQFIAVNEKAQLQWNFEKAISSFESKYNLEKQ